MGQIQRKTGKRNVNSSTELKGPYLHSKNVLGTHRVLSNIRLVFLLHIPHGVSCAGPGFHPQQAVLFRELADPWTGGVAVGSQSEAVLCALFPGPSMPPDPP